MWVHGFIFALADGGPQIDLTCKMQKFTTPTPNDHLSQYGDLSSNTECVTNKDLNPVWVADDRMVVYNVMWNSFRMLNFGKL